jgi:hypothetical protein
VGKKNPRADNSGHAAMPWILDFLWLHYVGIGLAQPKFNPSTDRRYGTDYMLLL